MAIIYGLSRKVMSGGTGKFYAHAKSVGVVSMEELCEGIASRCSWRKSMLQAAAMALSEAMAEHLAAGKIVELGGIGRFQVLFGSVGVESPDRFLARKHIKSAKIVYRPGKEMKRKLKGLEFKKERG